MNSSDSIKIFSARIRAGFIQIPDFYRLRLGLESTWGFNEIHIALIRIPPEETLGIPLMDFDQDSQRADWYSDFYDSIGIQIQVTNSPLGISVECQVISCGFHETCHAIRTGHILCDLDPCRFPIYANWVPMDFFHKQWRCLQI